MNWSLSRLAQPVLRALSPERAHEAALVALELGLVPGANRGGKSDDPALHTTVFGLDMPNPIAIAAGFDKDGRVFEAVLNAGCGFAEVGTITPRAQPGNARPRVFRLSEDRAIINRLGFNNGGFAPALARLEKNRSDGVIGVNIGANKDASDRVGDYVGGLNTFYDVASYFMVNISSPNTPGLRDLQSPDALEALLSRLMGARDALVDTGKASKPIIVKIAPDISQDELKGMCGQFVAHRVDGIAVSNTTLARDGLISAKGIEAGGLSGRPMFHRSTVMLGRIYAETGGRIPLIGIGGVDSGARALEKIEAGASLIQLYTGLIYEGFELISRINSDLAKACVERGVANYSELVGTKAASWALKPLDGMS